MDKGKRVIVTHESDCQKGVIDIFTQIEELLGCKLGGSVQYLTRYIEERRNMDGAIVEFGVYRGGSLAAMALYMKNNNIQGGLIGLDTFCGVEGLENFSDTSVERVGSLFAAVGLEAPNLLVGEFAVTVRRLPDKIKLAFLDCDLYDSYMVALHGCYNRMVKGGVIVLDEYYSKKYPEARKAVDQFFSDKSEKPEMYICEDNGWERWCVKF